MPLSKPTRQPVRLAGQPYAALNAEYRTERVGPLERPPRPSGLMPGAAPALPIHHSCSPHRLDFDVPPLRHDIPLRSHRRPPPATSCINGVTYSIIASTWKHKYRIVLYRYCVPRGIAISSHTHHDVAVSSVTGSRAPREAAMAHRRLRANRRVLYWTSVWQRSSRIQSGCTVSQLPPQVPNPEVLTYCSIVSTGRPTGEPNPGDVTEPPVLLHCRPHERSPERRECVALPPDCHNIVITTRYLPVRNAFGQYIARRVMHRCGRRRCACAAPRLSRTHLSSMPRVRRLDVLDILV